MLHTLKLVCTLAPTRLNSVGPIMVNSRASSSSARRSGDRRRMRACSSHASSMNERFSQFMDSRRRRLESSRKKA